MNHLIATLSAAGADNWQICKRTRLWGTAAKASHSKHAVKLAEEGDRLFVWQSAVGLIATATIAGPPFPFRSVADVPWPDPESYRFGIPLTDIEDLAEPIPDPFDGYASTRFGVQTYQLQSGFAVLRPEQAQAINDFLAGNSMRAGVRDVVEPTPVPPPETTPPSPLAAAYLRPASSVADALLALYRQNRVAAETGELVLIGPEELRADFEAERRKAPFDELGDRVVFVTPDELEQRLRSLGS